MTLVIFFSRERYIIHALNANKELEQKAIHLENSLLAAIAGQLHLPKSLDKEIGVCLYLYQQPRTVRSVSPEIIQTLLQICVDASHSGLGFSFLPCSH